MKRKRIIARRWHAPRSLDTVMNLQRLRAARRRWAFCVANEETLALRWTGSSGHGPGGGEGRKGVAASWPYSGGAEGREGAAGAAGGRRWDGGGGCWGGSGERGGWGSWCLEVGREAIHEGASETGGNTDAPRPRL